MSRWSLPLRAVVLLLAVEVLAGQTTEALGADLKPKTLDAFTRYLQATEARIDHDLVRPGAFLYVEGLPEPQRTKALATLKRGDILMQRLETRDPSGREIRAPGGIIHHWLGAVFIPGVSLRQVREVLQDYDHHQDIYPEVVRSRLVRRDGDDFTIFYRLRKHKVITVTLDTEHTAHYALLDPARGHSRSHATRIAEVENAGQPNEQEKPVGHDGGFLWQLDSDWRYEERDGGAYVECESVSLTRDIPTGLGWLIRPFITGIPKESLENTLGSTRSAVVAGAAVAPKTQSRPDGAAPKRES